MMKMMKTFKRALALALVLMLLCAQFPAAYAEPVINWQLENITASPTTFSDGDYYSGTLSPATGYHLPDTINLTNVEDNWEYNSSTGSLSFGRGPGAEVCTVTASAVPNEYTVALDGETAATTTAAGLPTETVHYNDPISFSVSHTPYPDNYQAESVIAHYGDNSTINLALDPQTNKYSFNMPAGNTTISVDWSLKSASYTVTSGSSTTPLVSENGWYKATSATVTPVAPAVNISKNNVSGSSVQVSEGSTTIILIDSQSMGYETSVKLDGTAPTATVKYNGEALGTGENAFLYGSGKVFTVEATDAVSGVNEVSGVKNIQYAFASPDVAATLTDDDINSMELWTAYPETGIPCTTTGSDQVLLVKVTDNAGNVAYQRHTFILVESEADGAVMWVLDGGHMQAVASGSSTTYYVKGTTGTQDLYLHYTPKTTNSFSNPNNSKPQGAIVTVKKDGTEISAGFAVGTNGAGTWKAQNTDKTWDLPISLDLAALADGTYTVGGTVTGKLGSTYTAAPVTLVLFRTAPKVNLEYLGMVGYDTGSGYTKSTSASDSDTTHEDFTSTKTLYTKNTAVTVAVTAESDFIFADTDGYTVKLDGADVPAANVSKAGNTVTCTVPGTTAEGEHTLVFTLTGFNGTTKTVTAAKIVVDKAGITADEITAKGAGENGAAVNDGIWTDQNELVLTIADIKSLSGLASVTPSQGVTVASDSLSYDADAKTWTWTGSVSGEQNHTYTVTLTDKAGNTLEKTFTVKIDTTKPAVSAAKVFARKATTDMALIADQFTFGVFHVDYDCLSTTVDDAAGTGTSYDTDAKTYSGIGFVDVTEDEDIYYGQVEYCFVTSDDQAFRDFFKYIVHVDGQEDEERTYTQADVKASEAARTSVKGKIEAHLASIADTDSAWTACTWDGSTKTWVTGQVNKDKQYVAFFRATDAAGNKDVYYRSIIITDSVVPTVAFALATDGEGNVTAPSITTADNKVIYVGAVPLTVTVTEPNQNDGLYAGLDLVTYTVYCGGQAFGTATTLYDSSLNVPTEGNSTASTTTPLNEQGLAGNTYSITLDDLADGTALEGKDVCVAVTVRDIAGKSDTYYSNAQLGYLNVDKSAPVVTVDFEPASSAFSSDLYSAGRTYYAAPTAPGRKATITVEDANFDPATADSITLTDDATVALTDITWTEEAPDAYGKVKHTGIVYFAEGEHSFGLNIQDLVAVNTTDDTLKTDHSVLDAAVTYNSTDEKNFEMDWTDPVLSASFSRIDGKGYGAYNNVPVSMTASCAEKNFSAGNVAFSVTRNGAAVAAGMGWSSNGAQHSATYYFTDEGSYTVDMSVTDLAGRSDKILTEEFVVDLTKPVIEITGVEDEHAYNAETIVPVIKVTDTYYDELGVKITLTGANGGKGFFDEAYIAGGQAFTFENIEDDDLYTLVVEATDLAGNTSKETVRFSVNRNGSVFTPGGEIGEAMDKGLPYFRDETLPPVRVVETNVDIIESAKLYLTKDNTNIDLVEGRDYTITRTEVNGGWSQYTYEINKSIFVEDGVYRVSLVTKDKAGNAKNAESVVAFILDNTPPLLIVSDLRSGAIYNDALKHVSFLPSDNLLLSKVQVILNGEEIAVWEGEELTEMLRSNAEFSFDIPESNSRQDAQIILTDAAGNENENQLFEKFLVSTNLFVRFYNNKPVFFGTIIGLAVLGGSVAAFLSRRKKASAASAAVEE